MREVVKKEVIKLLDAGIIYLVPHSEWVSPVRINITHSLNSLFKLQLTTSFALEYFALPRPLCCPALFKGISDHRVLH
jgi:hypothetical protein